MTNPYPITARYNELNAQLFDVSICEYDSIMSEMASIEASGLLEEEAYWMLEDERELHDAHVVSFNEIPF